MDKAYDNLFVGDLHDADNQKKLEENDIEVILNVASPGLDAQTAPSQEIVENHVYVHFPLKDNGTNTDFLVRNALSTGRRLHQEAQERDSNMLVNCAVGSSRSVTVGAALMSLSNERRVRENIKRIRSVRPVSDPHPELVSQVSRLTAELFES